MSRRPLLSASSAYHRTPAVARMMSFRLIGMSSNARTSAADAPSRVRRLPYDRSRVRRPPAMQPAPAGHSPWRSLTPREYVFLIILATLIGRIILASVVGLGVDESYQVAVSRPLSLSYFE